MINMKSLILSLLFLLPLCAMDAQTEELTYYLPKTELRFVVRVEKTDYTPGEFAKYSERFLRKAAEQTASTTYRLIDISMYSTSVPDSAKCYTVPLDKKHTIFTVEKAANGVLQAINAKGKTIDEPTPFVPARKAPIANPHDYMSEDILTAGSSAKMAELTAQEIYDIRSSRNDLNRGEAEYMPKDGEQLRIMLANLDQQEAILTQVFQGVTLSDTLVYEFVYCPMPSEQTSKDVLFRLSKHLGIVDSDDMAGVPYYIEVKDQHVIPRLTTAADNDKKGKDEAAITVNMPGKVKVYLTADGRTIAQFEAYAAQYGSLETLSSTLFSKKTTSHVQLNPITGNVEYIETEPVD